MARNFSLVLYSPRSVASIDVVAFCSTTKYLVRLFVIRRSPPSLAPIVSALPRENGVQVECLDHQAIDLEGRRFD